MSSPHRPRPEIDIWTTCILLASLLVAVIAGVLTWFASSNWAMAGLSGGTTFPAALCFFAWLFPRSDF